MRKSMLSYLLLPIFASASFLLSAAPANTASVPISASAEQVEMQASQPRLDLNKADALTLQTTLNGIGKTKADAIVAYREQQGPFTSVDELLEIKGIGKALLDRNRDKLMVE
ncbi:ComEA family DNA-binding protein [Pseudomonas sp. UFMG81]|jgi:competence protein ComEA|uniref:ComEA family DNA-binding protein n=1 Tax=Pseudomonas sp. UFMG81 TaxID=2745936 RepID=UPI00188EE9FE|nr:helix-hairpin-helix domain-containing protein [Pseudomonas sp. UFMG81]